MDINLMIRALDAAKVGYFYHRNLSVQAIKKFITDLDNRQTSFQNTKINIPK